MTKYALALAMLWLIGCGPRIPDEFTVSGETLDFWLEATADEQAEVRARAVRALGNVGPDVPEVVEALSQSLSDPDPKVRTLAAQALLNFGSRAKTALPALTVAQNDADETVRDIAASAVQKIEGR